MADISLPPEAPAPGPESGDLRAITSAVEEHMAFWNVLTDAAPAQEPPAGVSLDALQDSAGWLMLSSAPLYPSQGAGGARGLLYRLLNLGIKIFGGPQIAFNRKLRDYLGQQQAVLQELNQRLLALREADSRQRAQIESLRDRLGDAEAEAADCWQEIETLNQKLEQHGGPRA